MKTLGLIAALFYLSLTALTQTLLQPGDAPSGVAKRRISAPVSGVRQVGAAESRCILASADHAPWRHAPRRP